MLQVIAADLDGDGDIDLVSTNRERATVAWYENLLVQATPAPLLVSTPSPESSAAEISTPTPSPTMLPASSTLTSASSTDRTKRETERKL